MVSVEGTEDAKKTQEDFPHLVVVADKDRKLSGLADVIHAKSAPDGGDSAAPATLLVDRQGKVCWDYRPARFLSRLSPGELLAAIDREMDGGR